MLKKEIYSDIQLQIFFSKIYALPFHSHNKIFQRELSEWLKWYNSCLASMRSWVQIPVPQEGYIKKKPTLPVLAHLICGFIKLNIKDSKHLSYGRSFNIDEVLFILFPLWILLTMLVRNLCLTQKHKDFVP
jgi:hypothetical protein